MPSLLELGEMSDVAGLIAPRAFVAINGQYDDIFPVDETKKAFIQLQRIYTAAGVPDNCNLYIGNGGHHYYKAEARPFARKYLYQ